MNQRIFALICSALALIPMQTILATEINSKAPACLLASLKDTQRYDLQQFHGKVLYVDFWASWCPPCAESFPFLNELDHGLKDKGLQVIGVNMDQAPDDAKAFLAKYPADFTVAADVDEKCARAFDVQTMPSSYLIDRNGVIRHIHFGFRPGEAKDLQVLAEQLLAEKPGQPE